MYWIPTLLFFFTVIYIYYHFSGSGVFLIEALHTRWSGLSGLHWGFVGFPGVLTMLPSHGSSVPNHRVYVYSSLCMSECVSVFTCFVHFCHSKTWASGVSNKTTSSARNGQSRWNLSNTSKYNDICDKCTHFLTNIIIVPRSNLKKLKSKNVFLVTVHFRVFRSAYEPFSDLKKLLLWLKTLEC